jgi:uncharacterized protein with GYD domain
MMTISTCSPMAKLSAASSTPMQRRVGSPWMWALTFPHQEGRTSTYGYAATREAAMAAFAKSWRREWAKWAINLRFGVVPLPEDARELAKKVGVEIKHLYLTSGDTDLVIFVDAPSGDNVAKFALAISSLGNVRTRTVRAWSADEYRKLISELP